MSRVLDDVRPITVEAVEAYLGALYERRDTARRLGLHDLAREAEERALDFQEQHGSLLDREG